MFKLYTLGILLHLSLLVSAKYCVINEDCNENSICNNGLCMCAPGKVPSQNGISCLDIAVDLGFECTEDIQCLSWITGPSVCTKDGVCGCDPGYRYRNNTCTEISPYNKFCSFDYFCYDGINSNALRCNGGVCNCNYEEGYYLRGDFDCRISGLHTDKCFFDIDCESDDKCCEFNNEPAGKCVSKSNPKSTCSNLNKLKKVYQEKYDESVIADSNTPRLNINIECNKNEDCSKVVNSFCPKFRNTCTCKEGFVYQQSTNSCVEALGSTCYRDGHCLIENSVCNSNNVCSCKDFYINSNYNDKCFKPARDIGMSCTRDENCYSMGIYAICNNKNKCECGENSKFDEKLMLCRPQIDTCDGNKCYDNCKHKEHSTCVGSKCVCDEHYLEEDSKCLADIGYECSNMDTINCLIENAYCFNDKCVCLPGFVQTGNRKCEEELCFDNCTGKPHSFCDNHHCVCEENYWDDEVQCLPDLGYECNMESNPCIIENAECKDQKCECIEGYIKEDRRKCRKENESGDKPCTTIIQIFMNNNFTVVQEK